VMRLVVLIAVGVDVADVLVLVVILHSYIVVHQFDLVPSQHVQLFQSQQEYSLDLILMQHHVNFFHVSFYDKFGLNFYVAHWNHVVILPREIDQTKER
jgi:hypothetical protein